MSATTIPSSGSAATARANDDCQALFAILWSDAAKTAPIAKAKGETTAKAVPAK